MPRITNRANLPLPLVQAVSNDPYDKKADYSVTELIGPARIGALKRQHADELEEDAADRIWALLGQIGHTILERAASKELTEHRLYTTIDGKSVSGQLDLWYKGDYNAKVEQHTLIDYKFTSIWAVKDGLKPEWEQQCNLNALLCRENHIEVTKAEIVVIFRDWSVGEARRNPQYPQQQVQVMSVPLWLPSQQKAFLEARVKEHEDAKVKLPQCTDEERWAKPAKWAVMKKGASRALKLHDTHDEAMAHIAELTTGFATIEHRPAVQTRCLDYCPVSNFCSWWQDYKKAL